MYIPYKNFGEKHFLFHFLEIVTLVAYFFSLLFVYSHI